MISLVQAYCEKTGNEVGGSLHVVLEDGNVSNGSIEFCRKYAVENNDPDGVALAELLLGMSLTQRRKVAYTWRD